MLDAILDAVLDTLKLLPFLFITYLLMEYIEHKTSQKSKETIKKSGSFGPIIGAILRRCSTMWIFSISYKSLCWKSYYNWNISCNISFYIRRNATNSYI